MLKRLLRWLLITGASLVVLVALFYAEENWRGKHAWEKYKREREAKGDSFEWASVVPPPVPDEQNFAMTPLFAELFPKRPEHPRLETVKLPDCPKAAGSWREGHAENLAAWKACFTNDDVLAALALYDPITNEITEASRRPHCRFPIRYEVDPAPPLPHLSGLRSLVRVYRLRAIAELSAGQVDAAFDDAQTCLRLTDTIKDEPALLSFLVRVAMLDLAIQPVWEGLAAHRWNDNQLAALQGKLENINMSHHLQRALQGERISAGRTILWLGHHREETDGVCDTFWQYVPQGWFYMNAVCVDRYYSAQIATSVHSQADLVSPQAMRQVDHSLEMIRITPYTLLCKLLAPAQTVVAKKMARSQTTVDEAAVACALERYRLAHGQMPDTLDALVPQFLSKIPHDVIDGQPLRYRRTAADQYLLYSIGWNETDDGGQIAWTTGKPPRQDQEQGDWAWFSQPQPAASQQKQLKPSNSTAS